MIKTITFDDYFGTPFGTIPGRLALKMGTRNDATVTSKIAVFSGDCCAKTLIEVVKKVNFRTKLHARVSQDYANRDGKWSQK